jgi:YggT family protein
MGLIANLLITALYALVILVIVRAVFSYISPYPTNPVSRFAWTVTEPILRPIRRQLPPVSGLDLSPMVVCVVAFLLIGAISSFH